MRRRELSKLFFASAAGAVGRWVPAQAEEAPGADAGASNAALADTSALLDVRRHGLVPNDPAAAPANTQALQALLDPGKPGPAAHVAFPNSTGHDVYHFNAAIAVRDNVHLDLMGSTLRYTGKVSARDSNSGLLFALRDFTCENGSIEVACDTSAASSSGSGIQIGARGDSSPRFTVWDSLLPVPLGNIQLRNLRISIHNTGSNVGGSAGIAILGGVQNLVADNIVVEGNGNLAYGIVYEFGWATREPKPEQRQTSHAHNLRFSNIIIRNLDREATAMALGGVFGCIVDGLLVVGAKNGFWGFPAESMFYRPQAGVQQLGIRSTIALRNLVIQTQGGAGVLLTGAQSAARTYLGHLFAKLGHPADYVAESSLGDFRIEGFAIASASGWGIMTSAGHACIRDGRVTGCQRGIVATDECTSLTVEGVEITECQEQGMQLDLGGAMWNPPRGKKIEIRSCYVAGNSQAAAGRFPGIEIGAHSASALIENCRFGYEPGYAGQPENRQGDAVSVRSETAGNVLCRNNHVGGVATSDAVAYRHAASGASAANGNTIERASGITTTAGSWLTDFQADSAQALQRGSTIGTRALRTARVTCATALGGVLLEPGCDPGQMVTIIHEGAAADTITFAEPRSSHVADGIADTIAGSTSRTYVWNTGTRLWYPCR